MPARSCQGPASFHEQRPTPASSPGRSPRVYLSFHQLTFCHHASRFTFHASTFTAHCSSFVFALLQPLTSSHTVHLTSHCLPHYVMSFKVPRKRQRAESVTSYASSQAYRSSTSPSRSSAPGFSQPPSSISQQRPSQRVVQWATSQTSRAGSETASVAESAQIDRLSDATDADLDALDEIIMSVDIKERGTIGCSYYVAREEKLYFMQDMSLGSIEVIDSRELPRSARLLSTLIAL